jgi:hypothetical protein
MKITNELVQKVLSIVDAGLVSGMGEPVPGKMCVEAAFEQCTKQPGWQLFKCEDCWYSIAFTTDELAHWLPLPEDA